MAEITFAQHTGCPFCCPFFPGRFSHSSLSSWHTRTPIFYFQLLPTRPRLLVEEKKLGPNNVVSNFL